MTENSLTIGDPIGLTVLATDPETEHSLGYFIDASNPHSVYFSVDRTSGVVSLAQAVDYDPPLSHRLLLFAVRIIIDYNISCCSIIYVALASH